MQKILIIHNKYRNIGGEDIAVENEVAMLKEFYEVRILYFSNTVDNYLIQIKSFLLNNNKKSSLILEDELKSFKPDFAYVHNTWFKASTGIFKILENHNINTILKIHNFRYFCTRSFLTKNHLSGSESCNACGLSKHKLGIFNKYFQESFIKSLIVNHYGKKYFEIIKTNNIKIFVLTKFHKLFMEKLGIESEKIQIFPNYLNINNIKKNKIKENYIVYAGRISKEKGVEEVIKAYKKAKTINLSLRIIGDGPELNYLKKKYDIKNISFMGEVNNKEVLEIIQKSKAVITGTKLFEGQPTLLCEASLMGVPSIFPRVGGILEFFPKDYKLSFEDSNLEDLIKKIKLVDTSENIELEGKKAEDYILEFLDKEALFNKFKKVLSEFK